MSVKSIRSMNLNLQNTTCQPKIEIINSGGSGIPCDIILLYLALLLTCVCVCVWGLPFGSSCSAGALGDADAIPWSGRSPGGGHGSPFQYSCLENPMDRGAWPTTVYRITKSWTQLYNWPQMHVCVLNHSSLCDPMNCSPPGSSVHGSLQVRILEWAAMPSSRGPSQPRCWTCISYISCIGMWVLSH